jgi:SAM-dependent methyltransferase
MLNCTFKDLFGLKDWHSFWHGQVLPLHRFDNEEYYRAYAQELVMLFDGCRPDTVLELGCGNGALFCHLGFQICSRFRGVDFSESMLYSFETAHAGVDLVQADAASYLDDRTYDLIFSNALVQHLTPNALGQHLANAKRMLGPGGRIVCGSVPWKALRSRYFAGEFSPSPAAGVLRRTLRVAGGNLTSTIGTWYELTDFIEIAQRNRLKVVGFHGSFHYPYRFHAVLTEEGDQNN